MAAGVLAGLMSGAGAALAAGTSVVIADKGFAESRVVAQVYAQVLRAEGFTVSIRPLQSTAQADAAVREGAVDMYPEYTGTALLAVLGRRPTPGRERVWRLVRDGYAARGLAALPPAPFSDENAVACTRAAVRRERLSTISSLGPRAPRLAYAANAEHLTRADGLPLLARAYGIRFGRILTTPIDARYTPLRRGRAQCVYAFTTDPQIARLGLVVLRDDRRVFQVTPYQGFPVVSRAYLDTAPAAFVPAVDRASALLDQATVARLNARVVLDGVAPADAAADLLRERGVTPG